MNAVHQYLKVPVELSAKVLSCKLIRPFQIYLKLNSMCSGKIKIDNAVKNYLLNELNLKSVKTVNANLKILLSLNWVGYNPKSQIYFIRGIDQLRKIEKCFSRAACEFRINDINKLKAFLVGSVISNLINRQKRIKKTLERNNGRSKHGCSGSPDDFPIANEALAKCLKVALSTAYEHKQIAVQHGYLKIRPVLHPIIYGGKHLFKELKILYRKADPDKAHLVRVFNNHLYFQGTDHVSTNLQVVRRRKIQKI